MNIDRRSLILGAAGSAMLAGLAAPALAASKAKLGPIGLQLYTVRDLFAADPVATLGKVAAVGYRQVEFGGGGYDKMDPAMLRGAIDRLGLTAPSAHIGYDALLNRFDTSIAMAKTLGADTVVLPYMTNEHRNAEAWQVAVTNINRIAGQIKQAGLGFAYHNHDFEFTVAPGGESLFDRLVKGVDPALMKIELDLYWAIFAGQDAEALIRRFPGRIYSYHVKDMRADRKMAAVGTGTIDFARLFTLNATAGVKHFYVENDEAPAPYIPDITKSFQTLRALRF